MGFGKTSQFGKGFGYIPRLSGNSWTTRTRGLGGFSWNVGCYNHPNPSFRKIHGKLVV